MGLLDYFKGEAQQQRTAQETIGKNKQDMGIDGDPPKEFTPQYDPYEHLQLNYDPPNYVRQEYRGHSTIVVQQEGQAPPKTLSERYSEITARTTSNDVNRDTPQQSLAQRYDQILHRTRDEFNTSSSRAVDEKEMAADRAAAKGRADPKPPEAADKDSLRTHYNALTEKSGNDNAPAQEKLQEQYSRVTEPQTKAVDKTPAREPASPTRDVGR